MGVVLARYEIHGINLPTLFRFVDQIECRKWLISIQFLTKTRVRMHQSDDKWEKEFAHTSQTYKHKYALDPKKTDEDGFA